MSREGDVLVLRPLSEDEARFFGGVFASGARACRIADGAYNATRTRAARVALLGEAAKQADVVVLHVAIVDAGTHLGRVVRDGPRAVLRAIGLRASERGDRLERGRFVHAFFDDEDVLAEIHEAGLRVVARRGSMFALEGGAPAAERPEPFARELARVAATIRIAERTRSESPERAVREMRARGAHAHTRGPGGAAGLRGGIGWIDALMPGGASCYRRILTEIALDRGAASETVVFGLDVGKTGHIALANREDMTFDVAFEIPPP